MKFSARDAGPQPTMPPQSRLKLALCAMTAPALSLIAGCAPAAQSPPTAMADYPGVLHAASSLHPDFSVQQTMQIRFGESSGTIDGVLQKQGNHLLVVGLGPLGVRAFVLEQSGDAISFKQNFGPPLPFPPRNIVVDIHRAYYMRVPRALVPAATQQATIARVHQDDEDIEELWQAGNLKRRTFRRTGMKGAVSVEFFGKCTATVCAPNKIVIDNGWFGYRLEIDSEEYSFFDTKEVP
jgi:hypothetical protein